MAHGLCYGLIYTAKERADRSVLERFNAGYRSLKFKICHPITPKPQLAQCLKGNKLFLTHLTLMGPSENQHSSGTLAGLLWVNWKYLYVILGRILIIIIFILIKNLGPKHRSVVYVGSFSLSQTVNKSIMIIS